MKIKLKNLLEPQKKSKVKAGEGLTEGRYPFFTSSPIQSKFYSEATYKGPALIFGTGGNASIHYCSTDFSTSTDCLVMYVKKTNIDLELIFFYLQDNIHLLEAGFKGAGLKHISKDYILDLEVFVPSQERQQEILKQIKLIDKLIVHRNTELDLLKNIVKSRFIEMFGDPVLNTQGWPMYQLSEYIDFLTSGSRGWAKYFTNNGEYFITIKNVRDCRITLENVQCITPPDNAEAKRTKVRAGDLLISITADLGRTGVVSEDIAEHGAYINQHLTCIRLKQNTLLPLYVAYYMESEAGKRQFMSKNQSAVKAGLNFDSIKSLQLIVPPIKHQKSFIEFIEQVDKSKYYNEKSREQICQTLNFFKRKNNIISLQLPQ